MLNFCLHAMVWLCEDVTDKINDIVICDPTPQ